MSVTYYLAVDIGASSGKHILGHVEDGRVILEEVYRFENNPEEKNGHLCWDLSRLFSHVLEGMRACRTAGKLPVSMGIDTWGVDFVLLDREGKLLGDAVAYRDGRTSGMDVISEKCVPFEELYERTGIQKQVFNTLYQLTALQKEQPDLLERAHRLLMVPDYLHYCLTGKKENEYTEATTSALVNAKEKTWDWELIDRFGFPRRLFDELRMPGYLLGGLTPQVQEAVGFDCTVRLPATHDTGSAFLAVPAKDEGGVYLSSGTWSLLGSENREPITTEASRKANFSNEGGYEYRFRYLKNIMGLWMIQSIRRELNKEYSFAQLESLAREADQFKSRVDVNDESFLAPKSMMEAVRAFCRKTEQPVPETVGEVVQCIYGSLADCYAASIQELEALTHRSYTAVNIVGGGSKDSYLNELTAKASGLPVFAGPTEGTALGNLMVQMIAAGEFPSLEAARKAERNSFPIQEYHVE